MHSHFPKPCITALLRCNDFSLHQIFWINLFFHVLNDINEILTTSVSINRQKMADFFE